MVSDGRYMWFGIPGRHMQYVPAPKAGFQRNWTGNTETQTLEDGRQVVKTSAQRHTQFVGDFWSDYREDYDIDVFNAFASGMFGSGPIIFANPYAAKRNLFAPQWASPTLVEQGWAAPTRTDPLNPATFGPIAQVSPGYNRPLRYADFPITTATYSASNSDNQYNHYIAIPPDQTLYVGASGQSIGSAGVFVQPFQSADNQTAPIQKLRLIDYSTPIQFNAAYPGSVYNAVRVYLSRTDSKAANLILYSMMAQLWPSNTSPSLLGVHYPGQGNLGLTIAGDAIAETYDYNGVKKGLNLTLEEAL